MRRDGREKIFGTQPPFVFFWLRLVISRLCFWQNTKLCSADKTQIKKENKTRPRPDGPNASGWYGRLRYRCSTQFNYVNNLSTCGTFLIKLLPLSDNCELLSNPQETYDLNLSAVALNIWSIGHFAFQQRFLVRGIVQSLVRFPQSCHVYQ